MDLFCLEIAKIAQNAVGLALSVEALKLIEDKFLRRFIVADETI